MRKLSARVDRAQLAHRRAILAAEMMADCRLCGWECGVDRTVGPAGRCGAPGRARVFQNRIEWVGERGLVPTRLVNFSGCNFRCSFCLTGRDSQDARRGETFHAKALGVSLRKDAGLYRSVTIEGGEASIFLPDALDAIAQVPDDVVIVWKTNGYATPAALELLAGCIDVFLVDYKFGNDSCARRLGRVENYLAILHKNLRWGRDNARMIVRHLLMPGHGECCLRPTVNWLSREMPGVEFSVITGFMPAWKAHRAPELAGGMSEDELAVARGIVRNSGLRMVEWDVADTPAVPDSATEPRTDEISIGRDGSVKVAFMSAELRRVLKSLESEFPMAVNL